jgi:hypothetical protein
LQFARARISIPCADGAPRATDASGPACPRSAAAARDARRLQFVRFCPGGPRPEGSHSRCARTPRMLISAPQGGAVLMGGGATATFTNTAFTSNTAEVTDAPRAVSAHAHRRAGARTPLASTRRARPLAIHHRVPLTRRTGSLALRAHARVIIMAGNDSEVASLLSNSSGTFETVLKLAWLATSLLLRSGTCGASLAFFSGEDPTFGNK